MQYAYEDLSDTQRLLGISVQGFAKGPDGGRDAKFMGTAELHPSKAAPWVGITIVQAKHTNGYNPSFSESDFYSATSTNTVLGKEIPRIKKLRASRQLDHYMLFANRRLAGIAESEIRGYISSECDIPVVSIYLCGVEQLETLLRTFPDVPIAAHLAHVIPPDSSLRYQLLHRTVSAVLEAQLHGAVAALVLVHSFGSDTSGNFSDFREFLRVLGAERVEKGSLLGPHKLGEERDLPLYFLWWQQHAKQ